MCIYILCEISDNFHTLDFGTAELIILKKKKGEMFTSPSLDKGRIIRAKENSGSDTDNGKFHLSGSLKKHGYNNNNCEMNDMML